MEFYLDLNDKRIAHLNEELKKRNLHTHSINDYKETTKEKVFVFSPAKKWSEEDLNNLPNNIHLFCGNINQDLTQILKNKNITHHNFSKDEHFTMKNAKLTAEGVLALLISGTEKSIYENNILILGAGRITKSLAVLFGKLGLKFSIATFDKTEFENCFYYCDKNFLEYDFLKEIQNFDVIINTRPVLFLDQEMLQKILPNTLFIETASINCLSITHATHFNYLPAPALPTKYCAKSAGKLILNKILGELNLWT